MKDREELEKQIQGYFDLIEAFVNLSEKIVASDPKLLEVMKFAMGISPVIEKCVEKRDLLIAQLSGNSLN